MLINGIFVASFVALVLMAIFCNAIYDWAQLAHAVGVGIALSELREGNRYWALPFSRILLILLAIACLIAWRILTENI
jgi:hypothetical protein